MARDRKRAKQRQRRRAQQQPGPPEASARSVEDEAVEDEVLEDEVVADEVVADDAVQDEIVHDAHEDDPNAAPDPLAHTSAEVDIAHLAEASAREPGVSDEPLGEDDYPHPDELEGDDAIEEAFGREPGRGQVRPGAALPREGNRFANFLRACVAELRRVQWPDRRHVGQATGVVLGFVVIAGTYLGVLDAAFSRLMEAIL